MIDFIKLKDEMKLLVAQLKDHKKVIRDPSYNFSWAEVATEVRKLGKAGPKRQKKEIRDNLVMKCEKKSIDFTKLCVLRALASGKQHLSPNTRLDRFPGLKGLAEDDLMDWVSEERERFQKTE